MRWIIDGNNVMGAGADGWWNDPPAAAARLTQQIALWCRNREDAHPQDRMTLVFDGRPVSAVTELAGGTLSVEFAPVQKRDAADDRIVELVESLFVEPGLTVVTTDKGLVARLPPGVEVIPSGRFRRTRLGLRR
jgi:hypothetical protein